MINDNIKNKPLKIYLMFLIVTLIMFYISPWEWPVENGLPFIIFNFITLLLFYLGYKLSVIEYKPCVDHTNKIDIVYTISLVISILNIYPRYLINHKVSSISIDYVINKVVLGVLTPGQAYYDKHFSGTASYTSLTEPVAFFNFISVPFVYFVLFASVLYWRDLSRIKRFFTIVLVISHIFLFLSIGTNKGIFDLVLVYPLLLLIKFNSNSFFSGKKIAKSKKIIAYTSTIVFVLVALSFFGKGNKDRKENYFYYNTSIGTYANKDSAVLKLLPNSLGDAYLSIDSYLTQGYFALDVALGMEFIPTYGVGNSFFLTSLAEKKFGIGSVSSRTYQHRISEIYNHSHYGKWHTMYVWLANDVTFFFVPLFVGLIGYLVGKAWMDINVRNNPFAIVPFGLLTIMIFYLPANNQVLGFEGMAVTFIVTVFYWLLTRRKIRFY